MCDIDMDFGSDYECDVSFDTSFEGLDSIDDTNFDSFDEASNVNYAESADDFENLDFLSDFNNGTNETTFDNEVNDLISLDDVSFDDTVIEEDIECLDIEQEVDEPNSFDTLDFLDDIEELSSEEVETIGEVKETMDLTELEGVEVREATESISMETTEEIEALIENTDDIEQLYDLRDSLVNREFSEEESIETIEELDEIDLESTVDVFAETEPNLTLDELSFNELNEDSIEVDPEITLTDTEVQELIENAINTEGLEALQDSLVSGEVAVGTEETTNEDSPMVLTRDITLEVLESRENDTEETLENYRDNLREYGVPEEQIEEFVEHEREKINVEYESLDNGDISTNIYYQPTAWEEVAALLTAEQAEQVNDEISNELDIAQNNNEVQELDINYDEIYEGIQRDALEEGFADVQIDSDPERLDSSLENFNASIWEGLTLDEQKDSMGNLADYVVDVIGFENPPTIEYYNNEKKGDFGGYDSSTNTLRINEYMLYNSDEAADTIAHELWHAHQHECSMNPQNAHDYQYQYNFENYIPPELGQEAYEIQLVEAEARAFAAQFKDRLSIIKGRSI